MGIREYTWVYIMWVYISIDRYTPTQVNKGIHKYANIVCHCCKICACVVDYRHQPTKMSLII